MEVERRYFSIDVDESLALMDELSMQGFQKEAASYGPNANVVFYKNFVSQQRATFTIGDNFITVEISPESASLVEDQLTTSPWFEKVLVTPWS